MTDLAQCLELLGLTQYLETLISEGFDTWETLLDITESDLTYLNFKLGHRRKLQRAIAESRGQPPGQALISRLPAADGLARPADSVIDRRDPRSSSSASGSVLASHAGTKRKYRRHPKTDTNAPERPPSAYVIFSNQVREDLRGQDLSFTEIAKIVGEKWQVLPTSQRENYEQEANTAKEHYYSAMAEYKKTSEFAQYQAYLAEFKAKHGPLKPGRISQSTVDVKSADGLPESKRVKPEPEPGSQSEPIVSSQEHVERHTLSRSVPKLPAEPLSRSASSPSNISKSSFVVMPHRVSPASSAAWSESLHSPTKPDIYSLEESPTAQASSSSMLEQPMAKNGLSRLLIHNSQFIAPAQQTPPAAGLAYSNYRPIDPWPAHDVAQLPHTQGLPQRDVRIPALVPELTRGESTMSSGNSSQPMTSPLQLLPPVDASKAADRRLPKPVSMAGQRSTQLETRGPLPPSLSMSRISAGEHVISNRIASDATSDQRSAWPALLQATNMAREADLPISSKISHDKKGVPPDD